jgi:tetratricopeptide (TPR) repeat protein
MMLFEFDNAESSYAKGLALSPSDKELISESKELKTFREAHRKFQAFMDERRATEAAAVLDYLLYKYPDWDEAKLKKAEALAKAGKTNEAMNYLKSLAEVYLSKAESYYVKGLVLLYSGDNAKAINVFKDGMKLDPDNKLCLKAYKMARDMESFKSEGNAMIKDKRYQEAADLYTKSLEVDPLNVKMTALLLSNRGLAYLRLEDLARAQ